MPMYDFWFERGEGVISSNNDTPNYATISRVKDKGIIAKEKQMASWALKDAETSVEEVFERAFAGEPQIVTRQGVPSLVIITYADYKATPRTPPPRRDMHQTRGSFVDFLRSCPVDLSEVIGERCNDTGENRRPVFSEDELT